ncbi:MAG: hypothetical protein HUJ61_08755 [Bacilli bacterium]|nr:hypothetical protein [Bacilli bacterium]
MKKVKIFLYIMVLCLLFTSCTVKPNLDDYQTSGSSFLIEGQVLKYNISYEKYDDEKITLLFSTENNNNETNYIYFYFGKGNVISSITCNGKEYFDEIVFSTIPYPISIIKIPINDDIQSLELNYKISNFKGYLKLYSSNTRLNSGDIDLFHIELY